LKGHRVIAAFVFIVALGRPLAAQSGELNDSTEYAMVLGTWVDNNHGPLKAIVLWRGPRGWRQPGGAAKERADSVFRLENLRAREAGRSFFGMGMAYGILDRHAAAVTVEGQRFSLDRTDSALVIMVAIPASDQPRAITTARIATGAFPEDLWPKASPSGDVHFPSPQLLRNVLAQVPAIGVFLR
jgi:hypothetical protein